MKADRGGQHEAVPSAAIADRTKADEEAGCDPEEPRRSKSASFESRHHPFHIGRVEAIGGQLRIALPQPGDERQLMDGQPSPAWGSFTRHFAHDCPLFLREVLQPSTKDRFQLMSECGVAQAQVSQLKRVVRYEVEG